MINTKYLMKNNFTCSSCGEGKVNKESYEYTTYITKARLVTCTKCFVQQFGKENAIKIKERE